MIQLILHLIGDYVTQSDWMAQNKRKSNIAAFCHSLVYSLPFLFIGSWSAFGMICGTHMLIDRFGLARYLVAWKNILGSPEFYGFSPFLRKGFRRDWISRFMTPTGYPSDSPPWLAVWLLIAADNTLHLAINYAALRWL